MRIPFLLAVIAMWCCGSLLAQESLSIPDPYTGLSDAAAKKKFEQELVAVRIRQRRALIDVIAKLETFRQENLRDASSKTNFDNFIKRLTTTTDFAMAMEVILKERARLTPQARTEFDTITAGLSDHWAAYQQVKLQYQPAAGRALARRWPTLSLDAKRCELSDYLALADQRPIWLLRNCPVSITDLIPKTMNRHVNEYKSRKGDLVSRAQQELQPSLDVTRKLAEQIADGASYSDNERRAAQSIAEALTAPYGRGLRGVMLCRPTDDLPENLRATVRTMLLEFISKTEQLKPAHVALVERLNSALDAGRDARKLEEQFIIEQYVDSLTHLIQPIRVLAQRTKQVGYFENATLLEVGQTGGSFQYRVEFTVDGAAQTVDASQIDTRPAHQLGTMWLSAVPQDGPGEQVTDRTDLALGQMYAHSPTGWKPCIVVDESPLGIIVRWQGGSEPIEFIVSRSQLRIVESTVQ